MTDMRKCDGPECSTVMPLSDPRAEWFQTFIPRRNFTNQVAPLHFCKDICLRRWTEKNMKDN